MENSVKILVREKDGLENIIEAPIDMNMSVMEVLKSWDYDIQATCGGMALCATCHIEVLSNHELPAPAEAELEMLDTIPIVYNKSRLSCQIRVTGDLEGLELRIIG